MYKNYMLTMTPIFSQQPQILALFFHPLFVFIIFHNMELCTVEKGIKKFIGFKVRKTIRSYESFKKNFKVIHALF